LERIFLTALMNDGCADAERSGGEQNAVEAPAGARAGGADGAWLGFVMARRLGSGGLGGGRGDHQMFGRAGEKGRRLIGMNGGHNRFWRSGGDGDAQVGFAGETGDGEPRVIVGEIGELVAFWAFNTNGHGTNLPSFIEYRWWGVWLFESSRIRGIGRAD